MRRLSVGANVSPMRGDAVTKPALLP